MTAEDIDRKVRALHPWPGVTLTIDGQPLKILEAALSHHKDAHLVTCKDGSILFLVSIQPPGKKPMSGAAWARGQRKV